VGYSLFFEAKGGLIARNGVPSNITKVERFPEDMCTKGFANDRPSSWLTHPFSSITWGQVSPILIAGDPSPESASRRLDVECPENNVGLLFDQQFLAVRGE
jgi:hypothetical protein